MQREAYGWTSTDAPECADYVFPAVIELLRGRPIQRVLDLGCGNGVVATALAARLGVEVIGVDADPGGINLARARLADVPGSLHSLRFEIIDGESDPRDFVQAFGRFDAVVSTEVLEHVFYPRRLVRFAHGVMHPGGVLVLSTPYHGYLKNLIIALLGRWDVHADPLWDGGHIKFWSRKTIEALLREQGFSVDAFRGVGRVPGLWKSMVVRARIGMASQ